MIMRGTKIILVAVLAAAGTTPGATQRATLAVTLTPLQVVAGPADPDATGTAEVLVQPNQGRLCWNLYVRYTDPIMGAHIHRAAAGSVGPPVVALTTPGADGHSEGCTAVDETLARQISNQAHEFYVNIHTAAFPAGAVRGQLRGGPTERQRLRPGGH